jgi:hypothetical protein
VAGGASNNVTGGNSMVGGGNLNTIQTNALCSFIGGGYLNLIQTNAPYSFIGGGTGNLIPPGTTNALIGGGYGNTNGGNFSAIAAGTINLIQSSVSKSIIGSGNGNAIQPGTALSVIGGGQFNTISNGAWSCSIGGGEQNRILSGAYWGTIPGGYNCTVGGFRSFAAGSYASATNNYAFVWADRSSDNVFSSFGDNTFSVRATNGVRFVSATDATGNPTAGVQLPAGGGAWAALSDRNSKENVESADPQEILAKVAALPVATWNYKSQAPSIRHIGPMAQDFHAAFGVGEDEKHITTIDEEGVALAAIKGLNEKLEQKDTEIQQLQQTVAQLKEMMAKLAAGQNRMEAK